MSRNYHAKRLVRELGISYTEALRRVKSGTAVEPPPTAPQGLAEIRSAIRSDIRQLAELTHTPARLLLDDEPDAQPDRAQNATS